ncbi:MAG TPA: preprotein translocase subunit SecE [Candidatus Saccharimonadales bacterium]
MAKSDKSNNTVTRISASDNKGKAAPKKSKAPKAAKKPKVEERGGIVGYFVGAWKELRQVHWPTRRATWGLTGAVLAFSAFFVVFILLLDAGFKYLFEFILK